MNKIKLTNTMLKNIEEGYKRIDLLEKKYIRLEEIKKEMEKFKEDFGIRLDFGYDTLNYYDKQDYYFKNECYYLHLSKQFYTLLHNTYFKYKIDKNKFDAKIYKECLKESFVKVYENEVETFKNNFIKKQGKDTFIFKNLYSFYLDYKTSDIFLLNDLFDIKVEGWNIKDERVEIITYQTNNKIKIKVLDDNLLNKFNSILKL